MRFTMRLSCRAMHNASRAKASRGKGWLSEQAGQRTSNQPVKKGCVDKPLSPRPQLANQLTSPTQPNRASQICPFHHALPSCGATAHALFSLFCQPLIMSLGPVRGLDWRLTQFHCGENKLESEDTQQFSASFCQSSYSFHFWNSQAAASL